MRRRLLLICAVACASVAGLVGASVATAATMGQHGPQAVRLRGIDTGRYASRDAALNAYWTPKRRKQALANGDPGGGVGSTATATTKGRATTALDALTKPPLSLRQADADPDSLALRLQTGVLFFTLDTGQNGICTAFSIPAGQGQAGVIQTAKHCVESTRTGAAYSNFMFIPGYGLGGQPAGPWGSFPGLRVQASEFAGLGEDYAFMEVGPNAQNEKLFTTAGSMSWGIAQVDPTGDHTLEGSIFGYAGGTQPTLCSGNFGITALAESGAFWTTNDCTASPGMSGGPWVQCQCDDGTQRNVAIGNIVQTSDTWSASGSANDWSVAQDYDRLTRRLTDEGINPADPPAEIPGHDELIVDGAPSAQVPDDGSGTQDQGPPPPAPQPAERTAYYTSWSIYANDFLPKDLDTRGIAGRLTTLDYAFENIDPQNLTCMEANHPASSDENDPNGNDGSSDAWADYQREFTADESVDGVADQWDQPLRGNFNQLKELKAKYPNLKILVSLGGWTYSKYFSDVAATAASREKFVSSCIDMYIKGNLPQLDGDPAGGNGAAAGIFDGFDIDWEFPGSANGHVGNHVSAQDTANFTALMAEFRRQLDALGGKHYELTAAVPSGPSDIDKLQIGSLAGSLDRADVMAYDMHGAFEPAGPTNFQAPLFDDPKSPAFGTGLTVNDAVTHYLENGFPADRLTLGVPLYGRGWTGVPDGGTSGLYQSVTGATDPFPFSQEAGVADYRELEAAGKLGTGMVHFDPTTGGSWVYDGSNFWSIESPDSLRAKRQYIADKGLAGIMLYSLEADDAQSTLLDAAVDPD